MKYFTFKLNSLQFDTIKHLFNHYGWDLDDSVAGEKKSFDIVASYVNEQHLQMENQSLQDTLSSNSNSYQESSSNRHDDGDDRDDGDGSDNDNSDSDFELECRFCFYAPKLGVVEGAYRFGPVRPSVPLSVRLSVRNTWQLRDPRTVYARILKFYMWHVHEK